MGVRIPIRAALTSGLGLVLLWAVLATGARSETASPWQTGEYRDFTPNPAPALAPAGVTTRALGPSLKLDRVTVQAPKVRPGDAASLIAQYNVAIPSGTIDIKETRVVSFNGAILTRLARVVTRPAGPVGSEYKLKVPTNAADGWYTVTTLIEPAQVTTRSAVTGKADAAFYVEAGPAAGPTAKPAAKPAAAGPGQATGPGEDGTLKVWTDKASYRVGDPITVFFETTQDGYLTLVNVGSSGKITILFPNRFSGGHEVKAGKTYRVPGADDSYELALAGPSGTELIYALRTTKPIKFVDSDFSRTQDIFQSVTERTGAFTRDINIIVKRTPRTEQSKAMLEVQVAP
jgi:hypothetical protein